jgi:hypothetical protein
MTGLPADLTHEPENEEWPLYEGVSSMASHRAHSKYNALSNISLVGYYSQVINKGTT